LAKFRDIIHKGCLYFTIFIFIGSIVGSSTVINNFTPSLQFLVMALAYSLFIPLSSLIYKTNFNLVLKATLHMLAHISFFSIDFIYFGGYYKNGISAFYILIIFIFVYIIISLIAFGIRKLAAFALSSKADDNYQNKFKK